MTKKILLLLLGVVLLGFILRFYQLGIVPDGFHRDEAFLSYNGYSILKTGRDIDGAFFPLHLKSFLYSPALYSYLTIPSFAVFGLNEFASRLPSALLGIATIPLVFFLTLKLFEKSKKKYYIGLLSSLVLAILPWHITLSRDANETVPVTFFTILGVICFLCWRNKQKWYVLVLSFVIFLTTLFIYQSPRSFLPLFIPLLFLFFQSKQITIKRYALPVILYVVVILLPVLIVLHSPTLSLRVSMLSITQQPLGKLLLQEQISEDGVMKQNTMLTRIFHNKALVYSSIFLNNYTDHFSYSFLFTDAGLPKRYTVADQGPVSLYMLPLLLFGLYALVRRRDSVAVFILGWLLLVPVGSALTFDDVPSVQRTLLMTIPLSLIIAYGVVFAYDYFGQLKLWKPKLIQKICAGIFCVIAFYGFAQYIHEYYIHLPSHKSWNRQEGYRELVRQIDAIKGPYQKVIITAAHTAPAMFFIFYEKRDPSFVQKALTQAKKNTSFDYNLIPFDKYAFSISDCPLLVNKDFDATGKLTETTVGDSRTLYVDSGECKIPSHHAKVLEEIKRTDGTIAFRILAFIP